MSLFDELKRRNVLRVAIFYLAGSWLLIQVLETLFPIFRLDETSIQIVVIIVAIGFVPALILSWVFELTPEGLKRDKDVDRSAPATISAGKGLDKIIIVILVLALGYFAVDKFVLDPARDAEIVETATERARTEALYESFGDKSIVVLPFINMSADPEQDYFADGISEELLNLLARIQELRVISRTSAFSFKGKSVDIATIAESLDVDHVLEGSIRKSGNKIRITAQLIDARTDSHIWSETFDRTLEDIFVIQDEIAAAVVEGLRVELLGEAPTTKKVNAQAFALMLKARRIIDDSGGLDELDDLIEAESLLEQALELDPEYIDALAQMARVYYRGGGSNPVGREEALQLARELVDKIATIDPDDGNADGWRSWFALYEDFDIAASARHLERALKARATDVEFFRGSALFQFITLGQLDAAVAIGEFVVAHDPLCTVCQYHLARAYRFVGKFDEAEATIRSALILTGPGEYPMYRDLGRVLMFKGDPEAALEAFEKDDDLQGIAIALHDLGRREEFEAALAKLHEDEDEFSTNLATVYAWLGDTDKAFEYLEKEYSIDRASLSRIMRYPVFRSLYDDPRWQALLHKLGMSDAQLAAIDFKMPPAVLKTLENR
jgi:TolB-like protein/Tfp pilus assembly protein PilF